MKDAKEVEQKLIDLRAENKYTYEEIAEILDRSVSYVRDKCIKLMKEGRIQRLRSGPKSQGYLVVEYQKVDVKPDNLGVCCQYPSCKFEARFTFSLVPLCKSHHEVIQEETDLYYSCEEGDRKPIRKHWAKISQRSAEKWVSQRASISIQTKSKQNA